MQRSANPSNLSMPPCSSQKAKGGNVPEINNTRCFNARLVGDSLGCTLRFLMALREKRPMGLLGSWLEVPEGEIRFEGSVGKKPGFWARMKEEDRGNKLGCFWGLRVDAHLWGGGRGCRMPSSASGES